MSKKIWFSQVLLLLLLSLTITSTASAAFFDWTAISSAIPTKNQWSFDTIYSKITSAANTSDSTAQDNSAVTDSGIAPQPDVPSKKVTPSGKSYMVTITAYSSTPDQTDDTPFTTASGTTVHDGVIAANFLPFGTLVRIPEVFGNKVFRVEDRMNSRYWKRMDIWFSERQAAKDFGIKEAKVEIVTES